jgi:hypothetical protein
MADRISPAQVQKFLKGVDYPASKREIVETARQQGADMSVLRALERLPERQYDGPNAISQEVGRFE